MRLMASLTILCAAGFLSACSAPTVRCTSPVDNPEIHYQRAMEDLDALRLDAAEYRFDRAVYCDKRFSRGYSGLGLVMAEKAHKERDPGQRAEPLKGMRENLALAGKNAGEAADEFIYHLARIRTAILLKEQGWLPVAEESFLRARELNVDARQLPYYRGKEAADYFMGLAYLESSDLPKARDRFAEVLKKGEEGRWHAKAETAWKRVDKVLRATAGHTVGKVGEKIALQDSVSRGDVAAFVMDELKLDELLSGRAAQSSRSVATHAQPVPADVLSHPFRNDILTVMKWKVRGLEPKYDEISRDYLFFPGESVSRGEMARILTDILVKAKGEEQLATVVPGQARPPFSDVSPASPFYTAIMTMTARGIMEGERSGEFRINDLVDGAEAIVALRLLKQTMNLE